MLKEYLPMDYKVYKVDFKHRISGKVITITLSQTKDQSEQQLKEIRKDFSWLWWSESKTYC